MKALEKELKGAPVLVFIDLEGTQFSHEVTEIGAYKVKLNDDLSVKKIFRPFKTYVRAKGHVGPYVTKMTSITDDLLKKEGVPFRLAQQSFHKYVGNDWNKCRFVTFGNQDAAMMIASASNNMDASMEEARFFSHHVFDFASFISRYVRDAHGNPMSLVHYLQLFGVAFEGQAHDALYDAYNLISLYSAFLAQKDLVQKEYAKALSLNHSLPDPVRKAVERLATGEALSPEEFQSWLKEELA